MIFFFFFFFYWHTHLLANDDNDADDMYYILQKFSPISFCCMRVWWIDTYSVHICKFSAKTKYNQIWNNYTKHKQSPKKSIPVYLVFCYFLQNMLRTYLIIGRFSPFCFFYILIIFFPCEKLYGQVCVCVYGIIARVKSNTRQLRLSFIFVFSIL